MNFLGAPSTHVKYSSCQIEPLFSDTNTNIKCILSFACLEQQFVVESIFLNFTGIYNLRNSTAWHVLVKFIHQTEERSYYFLVVIQNLLMSYGISLICKHITLVESETFKIFCTEPHPHILLTIIFPAIFIKFSPRMQLFLF